MSIDPTSTGTLSIEELSHRVNELMFVVAGGISFGDPTYGGTYSGVNGTPDNVYGSWVEFTAEPTAAGTVITCSHNLAIPVPTSVSGSINVRWIVLGIQDVAGTLPNGLITQMRYVAGGTVDENNIDLTLYSNIGAGGAEVKVTMFFMPASG